MSPGWDRVTGMEEVMSPEEIRRQREADGWVYPESADLVPAGAKAAFGARRGGYQEYIRPHLPVAAGTLDSPEAPDGMPIRTWSWDVLRDPKQRGPVVVYRYLDPAPGLITPEEAEELAQLEREISQWLAEPAVGTAELFAAKILRSNVLKRKKSAAEAKT